MVEEKQSIVEVRNLTTGFGDEIILKDVSFDVRRGEILVILGASGSGKSVLLKHMIGLYKPFSGEILVHGQNIGSAEGEDRKRLLMSIGVMYQNGALFGSMNLLENVRLPLEIFTDLPPKAQNLIAMMKLRLVGLDAFSKHMPAEVSGGMKKRAAIARAMPLEPEILFLDEPSAGLDPITSADLDELILKLSRTLGITFVVVSHELPSIYAIADRVVMLDKNKQTLVAEGSPEQLRDHSDNTWVRQFFNRSPSGEELN
ncbi:MAG: ATP-binding cassette domain-containing protein [Candidatus Omnitrophica bacterium]|nr:ATP-binding cassette domain-containing protein [Candidatus Omnitrophota bacterium]